MTISLPEMPEKFWLGLAHAGLTSVAMIYGGYALVAKAALTHGIHPFVFAFWRCAGGTLLMYLIAPYMTGSGTLGMTVGNTPVTGTQGQKDTDTMLGIPKNSIGTFLMLGCIMAINIVGALLALSQLPAVTCALFAPTVPVVATIMGAVLGVEAISIHKLGGILCSVAGAMIVTIYGESKSSGTANNMVLGVTFIVMNVCGMAAYFVLSKAVVKDHPPVTVMASSFLIATIAVFIVALCSVGFDLQVWAMNYDPVNYACLAYAVFLAATYNYCVLAWANKKTSPTTVTSYTTLQPLTAVVISSIFLGTHPTPAQSCGGCAIVAGLLLNIYAQILQDKEQNNQESKSLLASSKKETA